MTATPKHDHEGSLPTWPQIKESHPELAAKLMAGDLSARVEFARLALGGTVLHVRYPDGRIEYPDGSVEYPDGRIELTDGRTRYPDGTVHNPGVHG